MDHRHKTTSYNNLFVIASTTSGNGYALYDSRDYCGVSQEAYIEPKETIDCSGYSNIKLEFQQLYGNKHDTCIVQVTGDNWKTSENIFINQWVEPDYKTANPDPQSLDISNLVDGKSDAHFAVVFINRSNKCGYFWMIDDVKLTGTPITSSTIQPVRDACEFSVFPVPAREILNIQTMDGVHGSYTLIVMDLTGKAILEKVVQFTGSNFQLDISDLRTGTYILNIQDENFDPAHIKFIKY